MSSRRVNATLEFAQSAGDRAFVQGITIEEDNEAGKLDKAEEIVGVVLPANEDFESRAHLASRMVRHCGRSVTVLRIPIVSTKIVRICIASPQNAAYVFSDLVHQDDRRSG